MRAIVMLFVLGLGPAAATAAENRAPRGAVPTDMCLYAGLQSPPGDARCLSPQILSICYPADDKHPLPWWGLSGDLRCSQK